MKEHTFFLEEHLLVAAPAFTRRKKTSAPAVTRRKAEKYPEEVTWLTRALALFLKDKKAYAFLVLGV
ncbi:hypothetical protein H1D32_03475 [Anaerobacillus sp. CMMVII]|uniref:hypothetical protein n=1 Tax=Anaerobacillus sp. CMMVII TaxID=2755588 RepID=UPI0021B6F237|nr:hypothetical protein [Anaerobacillus sp. CMMVII]MCT8136896.1 hypothetical protein [Anaerobacillus sp. CMMVII]